MLLVDTIERLREDTGQASFYGDSMAKLNKPPIVELFIGIEVEPSPNGQPWNYGTAKEFAFGIDEPELVWEEATINHSRDIRMRDTDEGLPEVVEVESLINRVQLFDAERSKCLQFDHNQAVYNSLRRGLDYPGYDSVCAAAELHFRQYLKFFRPERIRQAVICYVDVIDIPVGDASKIELSDYFHMGVDVDESVFGVMGQYAFQAGFACDADLGPATLALKSVPGVPGQRHIRLLMEWQKICVDVDTLDLTVLRRRLDASQAYLSRCFRASFKEAGWKLFEPVDMII